MRERRVIEWTEDLRQMVPCDPPASGHYAKTIGRRTMQAQVELSLDIDQAAKVLGRKAAGNKTQRCRDGLLEAVCRDVTEISRHLHPS